MEYNYNLGISKKVGKFVHKFLLIVMLHSSFVAPSQVMLNEYFAAKDFASYFKWAVPGLPDTYKTPNNVKTNEDQLSDSLSIAVPTGFTPSQIQHNNSGTNLAKGIDLSISADIDHGIIGTTADKPLDFAGDNIFSFKLAQLPVANKFRAYLTYEIFGVTDNTEVPWSLNDRFTTGGKVYKKDNRWHTFKEELNQGWLVNGVNSVVFSVPTNANYSYEVRNVKVVIQQNFDDDVVSPLVLNTKTITIAGKGEKSYVKGFVRNAGNVKVYADEIPLDLNDGAFEGLITLTEIVKNRGFVVVKAFDDKGILGQEIVPVDILATADQIFTIEKIPERTSSQYKNSGQLSIAGCTYTLRQDNLTSTKTLSICQLREIDMLPMNSGLINVTKGGRAFRLASTGAGLYGEGILEVAYDETLLPHGYTAKDIRTYYFNKAAKTWTAVNRDSINTIEKTIYSRIKEGGDYINGIIQSPESPETTGFTPTMMNDITAADPSSEMTLIAPPEVSQLGTASVAYPIKVPTGRNGMQPQIAVQYNSEGPNGWLGQGWDISIPALTIDTRWGVPLLDDVNESELYMINGEQLMYPNLNGENWMPNRHYDVQGSGSTVYSTQSRPRITNAIFTYRKEGSFSKIERMGSSTSNYYWKVTNNDGTIHWYGGKDGVIDNAVIKNSAGKIVHWGLYMTEDVYKNNIIYEYRNIDIPTQSGTNANLNGGRIFNISTIYYTGFQNQRGPYRISFVPKTAVRTDVTVSARLGRKQVEPYFLDYIIVGKYNPNTQIRRYNFNIGYGKFQKGQLRSVSELDKDNKEFYNHVFDYYDDLAVDGNDVYFSAAVTQSICNDVPVPACPDSDGDGVCDSQDLCPTVPGLPANNGCPEVNNCVDFNLPGNAIYKYNGTQGHYHYSNHTSCFVSSTRYYSLKVGATEYSATANNIFAVHGAGNNPVFNRCPSYPLTTTPNTITANPDHNTRLNNYLSGLFSQLNIPITNLTTQYTPGDSGIGQGNSYNHSQHYFEFYSTSLLDLVSCYQHGTVGTAINWNTLYTQPVSTQTITIAQNLSVYVNNSTSLFGTYDMYNAAQRNSFQTAINNQYPGTTVTFTAAVGTTPAKIKIATTNSNLLQIKIVQVSSGAIQSFNFRSCRTVFIPDPWNPLTENQLTTEVYRWKANGGEIESSVDDLSYDISVDMTDNTVDKSLSGIYFSKSGEKVKTWFSENGSVITDAKANESLQKMYAEQFANQYKIFNTSYRHSVVEHRKMNQQQAVSWLNEHNKSEPEAVGNSTTLKKGSSDVFTTKSNGDALFTNYYDNLINNYAINFTPITFGNPDCPSFLNANFLVQGPIPSFNSAGAILGSSGSKNFNLGGHLGFGVDFSWDPTSKNITVGGGHNHSWDDSESLTSLVDINGDGLEDLVFKHFGLLYWKKHVVNRVLDANNNPQITHAFSASAPIESESNSINDFFRSYGETSSTNLQVNFGFSGAGAFAGWETSKHSSTSNVYFTDANADGLVDIVKQGIVYFNRINTTGNPYFEKQSLNTENMLIVAAPITVDPIPVEADTTTPRHDVVKVWEAPADGQIRIENSILNNDPDKEAVVTIEMGVQEPETPCGTPVAPSGNAGTFTYTINLGTATGMTCINYNAQGIPDKFDLLWNGQTFTTGYRGDSSYDQALQNAGVPLSQINTAPSPGNGAGQLCFNKTSAQPSTMQVTVSGPLGGTAWSFTVVCPGQPALTTVAQVADGNIEREASYRLAADLSDFPAGDVSIYADNYALSTQSTTYNFTTDIENDFTRFKKNFESTYKNSNVTLSDKTIVIEVKNTRLNFNALNVVDKDGLSHDFEFKKTSKEASQQSEGTSVIAQRFSTATCSFVPGNVCMLYGAKLNSSNPSVNNVLVNASTACNSSGGAITVKKGDRIYFRVHSVTNGNPMVTWNPKVVYTDAGIAAMTDQNGLLVNNTSYSDGFILSEPTPTVFPGTGVAKFNWTTFSVSNPTDEVVYEIISRIPSGNSFTENVVYTRTCLVNSLSSVSSTSAPSIAVTTPGTQFIFRVRSTSNVNWKMVEWKPSMVCITNQPIVATQNGPSQGNLSTSETKYPIPDYSIYTPYLCANNYTRYDWTQNNNSTSTLTLSIPNSLFASTDNGTVYFVVKRGNNFIGRKTIKVTNGSVAITPAGAMSLGAAGSGTALEFGFYTDDSARVINSPTDVSLLGKILNAANVGTITINSSSFVALATSRVNFYSKKNQQYGPMYRGWGQFIYNPSAAAGATPVASLGVNLLKESLLTITNAQATALHDALLDSNHNVNSSVSGLQNIDINSPGGAAAMQAALQNISNNAGVGTFPFLRANPFRDFESGAYTDKWIGLHPECYSDQAGARAATMSQAFSFQIPPSTYQGALNTGSYGIDKHVKGNGDSVSGGGSFGGFGASGTASLGGVSNTLTDYIDINGDRYPDIVTTGQIQYTTKTGGLYSPITRGSFAGNMSTDNNGSWGFSASGTFSKAGKPNAGSEGAAPTPNGKLMIGKPGTSSYGGGGGNNSTSISGNFGQGDNTTSRLWADVNGDGLPDIVSRSGSTVTIDMNLGNSTFNSSNFWGSFTLGSGKSTSYGAGVGFNYANASIEAGVSLGRTDSDTQNTLLDFNGDGLLDKVASSSTGITVDFNKGNKFSNTPIAVSNFSLYNNASTTNSGLNGTGTYSIIWPLYLVFFVIPLKIPDVSVTVAGGTSTNRTKKSVVDFDGDGYPDLVEEINSGSVKVSHSRIRRTDLLKTVHTPLGGEYTIDYDVQPVNYNNPNAKWVMTSLEIKDGYDKVNDGQDVYKKVFSYEKGKYDRRERDFYGYETVKTSEYALDSNGAPTIIYRTHVSKYYNESYFLSGLLKEQYVVKGNNENTKFYRTLNTYQIKKLNSTNTEIDIASSLPLTYDVGGREGRRSAAVLLTRTTTELYEQQATPQLVSANSMVYDSKGRISQYIYQGNTATAVDDYITTIQYHNLANNIITIPSEVKVLVGGSEKRRRVAEVNPGTGDMVLIKSYLNTSTFAATKMQYDTYGNLSYIEYPQNSAGDAMSFTYTYDPVYNKYIVNTTDAHGYSSSSTFNSDFDKVLTTTDLTGNTMKSEYDNFGRNTSILAPKEFLAGLPYTIKFGYYPKFSDLPSGTGLTLQNFVPVALTQHFDVQHPTNDLETITFMDGLARTIQIKKDLTLNSDSSYQTANYYEAMSVSGKTAYDLYGRPEQQYHPYYETKSNSLKFQLNEHQSSYVTSTVYDQINRVIKATDPTGNATNTTYSIGQDVNNTMAVKTKVSVNQNGSQSVVTENYKDVNGRVISTMNEGPDGALWSKFNYNAINEMLVYTDHQGLSTSYQYDNLGRKIFASHPDGGITTYGYDLANNILQLQTSNLAATGGVISYKYDINRLIHIQYPQNPDGSDNLSNVYYKYGNSGNETGRLIFQQDATGTQEFFYGNTGEVIKNTRTVVSPIPSMPIRQFTTDYTYDSWNRIQTMVYPDGEKVAFSYDLGGNLNQMTGEFNGGPYKYVERLDYDFYEERAYLKYGNKTENFYTYSPELRRLDIYKVKTSDGHNLLNNKYSYDKVGNIVSIGNTAGVASNTMGGAYNHTYTYDKLNRLKGAEGRFTGDPLQQQYNNDYSSNYKTTLKYNGTHGLVNKSQDHSKNNLVFPANTYNDDYKYIDGSHKVEAIIDNNTGNVNLYEYDDNGNVSQRHDSQGNFRKLYWDESNRLRVVNDNDHALQHYIYDAVGERVLKANSDVQQTYENGTLVDPATVTVNTYTTYPSAYLVIDGYGIYSKHYFIGTQRITSRMGEQAPDFFDTGSSSLRVGEADMTAIREGQVADLNLILKEFNMGKARFKEYKPYSYAQITQMEQEDNAQDRPEIPVTNAAPPEPQAAIYFYHPDHLGTSTFLTDMNGNAYQFFINLPFGETMAEQLPSNYYRTPYKFSGKELDEETGLYYYGARYYDPRASIWLSVDPLAEQYPNVNPYVYCFQNPVNLIDPDGRAPQPPAYYMNDRGFWIQGDASFGSYMGNVKPLTDRYMELTRIDGVLYHKNTNKWGLFNDIFGTNYVSRKAYSVEEETNNDLIRFGAEWVVTGVALKAIGGIAGQLLKNAGNSLWKVVGVQRGFVFEKMLNLKGSFSTNNFPVIDAFFKGVATSIKTLDLGAKSYLKGNAVFNTLKGYINKLAKFEGAAWGDDVVRGSDIKSKVLELGIPRGATAEQIQQINRAVEYAAEKGIKLNVRVVQ